MCLTKKFGACAKINIALEPRTVYKILTADNESPIIPGYKYHHGRNIPAPCPVRRVIDYLKDVTVDAGYLHAYYNKDAAHKMMIELIRLNRLKEKPDVCYQVVEMVIPKGAQYWVGLDQDIAATELVWTKED